MLSRRDSKSALVQAIIVAVGLALTVWLCRYYVYAVSGPKLAHLFVSLGGAILGVQFAIVIYRFVDFWNRHRDG